jgi:hypothetical protein
MALSFMFLSQSLAAPDSMHPPFISSYLVAPGLSIPSQFDPFNGFIIDVL